MNETCQLCTRRFATNADLGIVPEGEDGGLCWARFAGECVVDGKPLVADDVIRELRAALLKEESEKNAAVAMLCDALQELPKYVMVSNHSNTFDGGELVHQLEQRWLVADDARRRIMQSRIDAHLARKQALLDAADSGHLEQAIFSQFSRNDALADQVLVAVRRALKARAQREGNGIEG